MAIDVDVKGAIDGFRVGLDSIARNSRDWVGFLKTSSRFYKYPFADQVMIHSQRPDAVACASIDTWNRRMGRSVRSGAKGIALIDMSEGKPSLKRVFDYSDTAAALGGARSPFLWDLRPEHGKAASQALHSMHYSSGSYDSLGESVLGAAITESWDYLRENPPDLESLAKNNPELAGYGPERIAREFTSAVTDTAAYTALLRCGVDPESEFDDAMQIERIYPEIAKFSTRQGIFALGDAVAHVSSRVLRTVETAVKAYEAERQRQGQQYGQSFEAQPIRGLPAPQSGAGQMRVDEAEQAERASRMGEERHGPPEGEEPASREGGSVGLDGAHESAGDPRGRVGAAGGGAAAPPEWEQIAVINGLFTPPAAPISQSDIDEALIKWNGDPQSKLRVYDYMLEHGRERGASEHLRQEHGLGWASFEISRDGSESKTISWVKAQLRIGQLIAQGLFAGPEASLEGSLPEKPAEKPSLEPIANSGLEVPFSAQGTENQKQEESKGQEKPPEESEDAPDAEAKDAPDAEADNAPVAESEDAPAVESKDAPAAESEDAPETKAEDASAAESEALDGGIPAPRNFRISDEHLGEGGLKTKYRNNIQAIRTLKALEAEGRQAGPDEQEILSRYVGWGGIPQVFDEKAEGWGKERVELLEALTPEEHASALGSVMNAHFTSPVVAAEIMETVKRLGFRKGNVLEPACGIGNFFGVMPPEMSEAKLYGVELDSVSARIAKQLYPSAEIRAMGFERSGFSDNFFDAVIGNVPFGNYRIHDPKYAKQHLPIHDYFIAKSLDQARPGGIVAVITSKGTMDKKDASARIALSNKAELLGAVRLPNNAFLKNANTSVTADILVLRKREREETANETGWIDLGWIDKDAGVKANMYFVDHPEMVLGKMTLDGSMYGRGSETTCEPLEGADLRQLLHGALASIQGRYAEADLSALEGGGGGWIPADPSVKNHSFTLVGENVYYRDGSSMRPVDLPQPQLSRISGMIGLRDSLQGVIRIQMDNAGDDELAAAQRELGGKYSEFTAKHGLVSSRENRSAFSEDSSIHLLESLEVFDENRKFIGLADIFSKRTITPKAEISSAATSFDALAASLRERGKVDLEYMSQLRGVPPDELVQDLRLAMYKDPATGPFDISSEGWSEGWQTADEYLSGDVRGKLKEAKEAAAAHSGFKRNVEALEAVQPKDLKAGEISVRLGSPWVSARDIEDFIRELLQPPFHRGLNVQLALTDRECEWSMSGRRMDLSDDVLASSVYGTKRMNAYEIIFETLNQRPIKVNDTKRDADGRESRVPNFAETALAQEKQEIIKAKFKDWIWKDDRRRSRLVKAYNEKFNFLRPREFDGSGLSFPGMNPEMRLRPHQLDAVARILHGGNTLLAHVVGAGKTYTMIAAAMESKRIGLCSKSMFVVPNHLTQQWGDEFRRLYPGASLLVAGKGDFEPGARKRFCSKIATGDYDAVIIGHSQNERLPMSQAWQERMLNEQMNDMKESLNTGRQGWNSYTVKKLQSRLKSIEAELKRLSSAKKDDVITFEELGVDRLFVDEAHSYKNLHTPTKMGNINGVPQSDSMKASDMFSKCRYIDGITGGKGVVFATATPVSNTLAEVHVMMRYLQHGLLKSKGLLTFDAWAGTFGEVAESIELAPEGSSYRVNSRFSKFTNLPELATMLKEATDIRTADMLDLPVPKAHFETVVARASESQSAMVAELSGRAADVRAGKVDPKEDNMLKITGDGRKIGLDPRLMDPSLPDAPGSKINLCAGNVFSIWRDTQEDKLTQLVFCDSSTPSPKFNVYDDMKTKLAAMGVPEKEVAFVHDAKTDAQKKALFESVRKGKVRILLGSTSKLGTGTNVQDRLIALHDLDCPWRPSDLDQRAGRAIRQGNANPEVKIFRYVTEGTFDAYLWQTIENKQGFVGQIMTSKPLARSCDDIDETLLDYALIKAAGIGNPLLKEKIDLEVELKKLRVVHRERSNQRFDLAASLAVRFPRLKLELDERISSLQIDMGRQANAMEGFGEKDFTPMEIEGVVHTDRKSAGKALLEACRSCRPSEVKTGSYRGFQMELRAAADSHAAFATFKGKLSYKAELHPASATASMASVNSALDRIPAMLSHEKERLLELDAQMANAKAELQKPFPREDELNEKERRLAAVNDLLASGENGPADGAGGAKIPKEALAPAGKASVLGAVSAWKSGSCPGGKREGRSGGEKLEV